MLLLRIHNTNTRNRCRGTFPDAHSIEKVETPNSQNIVDVSEFVVTGTAGGLVGAFSRQIGDCVGVVLSALFLGVSCFVSE